MQRSPAMAHFQIGWAGETPGLNKQRRKRKSNVAKDLVSTLKLPGNTAKQTPLMLSSLARRSTAGKLRLSPQRACTPETQSSYHTALDETPRASPNPFDFLSPVAGSGVMFSQKLSAELVSGFTSAPPDPSLQNDQQQPEALQESKKLSLFDFIDGLEFLEQTAFSHKIQIDASQSKSPQPQPKSLWDLDEWDFVP